jgi:hypothetical protein
MADTTTRLPDAVTDALYLLRDTLEHDGDTSAALESFVVALSPAQAHTFGVLLVSVLAELPPPSHSPTDGLPISGSKVTQTMPWRSSHGS